MSQSPVQSVAHKRSSKAPVTETRRMPWGIAVTCLLITGLGLCGLLRADELYGRTQLFERQIVWLILAFPTMLAVAFSPQWLLRQLSVPGYAVTLLLLAVTLLMPPINGSRRWIPLGFLDLQASEPARIAFVLVLSVYLMHRENHRTVFGLIPPLLLAIFPMILIIREPDLDTALLYVPVLGATLFAAGARVKHLLVAMTLALACVPVLWTQMSAEQQSRIVSLFTQRDGGLAPAGDGFHLHQSKQVLALGGFWGSLNQPDAPLDDSAAWQLPASRTDFIFVMIGERYGFPGCAAVLLLYLYLVWKGVQTAAATRDPFGRLAIVGVTTLMSTQVLLNTGMTVGLLPITGTPLPLCSYGGSSLVTTYAAVGIVMNVAMSRQYDVADEPFLFRRQRGSEVPF